MPAGTAKVGLLLELVPLFDEEELLTQVTCPHTPVLQSSSTNTGKNHFKITVKGFRPKFGLIGIAKNS